MDHEWANARCNTWDSRRMYACSIRTTETRITTPRPLIFSGHDPQTPQISIRCSNPTSERVFANVRILVQPWGTWSLVRSYRTTAWYSGTKHHFDNALLSSIEVRKFSRLSNIQHRASNRLAAYGDPFLLRSPGFHTFPFPSHFQPLLVLGTSP